MNQFIEPLRNGRKTQIFLFSSFFAFAGSTKAEEGLLLSFLLKVFAWKKEIDKKKSEKQQTK